MTIRPASFHCRWMIGFGVVLAGLVVHAEDVPPYFQRLQTQRIESDPSIVWRQMGPGMSGNNYHVDWHPTDPNVLFLGPNMGTSYRSTDQGQTYETILDWDSSGAKQYERGPIEIEAPDFSHQDPDFGFATMESHASLWKTTNRGKTWTHQKSLEKLWSGSILGDVSVDPTDDNIWYVGAGLVFDINHFGFTLKKPHGYIRGNNTHTAGVWKSTDKGENWKAITPAGINKDAHVTKIIVHPAKPKTIFLATTYGFYKSLDGGESWSLKDNAGFDHNTTRSLDMHFFPSTGKVTLYAIDLVKWKAKGKMVVNDGGGVFRSEDEGESWTCINSNLPLDAETLSSNYQFRTTYYKWAISRWFGIKEAKAKELYPEKSKKLMHRVCRVRVDPNNPDKIFVLNDYKGKELHTFQGGTIWRTENGGKKWFVTLRNGKAWEGEHQQYWRGRGNPTSHNITWAAQRQWKEEDSYFQKAGCALTFNADGSVIACQMAKVLMLSRDGGDTWAEIDETEVKPGSNVWLSGGNSNLPGQEIYQDERLPNTVFFCSGENDFWVTIPLKSDDLSGVQAAKRIRLGEGEFSCSTVVLHPRDEKTIFTLQSRQTHRGELLKSTDGGKTFVPIGTPVPLPWGKMEGHDGSVHQQHLTIDPSDPDFMYFHVPKKARSLSFAGDSADGFGMHKSSDGGKTWIHANKGLPKSLNVSMFVLTPDRPQTLFAGVYGTGGGLFRSDDRAESWQQVELPKGVESVSDIQFSQDGKLYISCGHARAKAKEGGVYFTTQPNPTGKDWTKIFFMPSTGKIAIAAYDPKVILVSCWPATKVNEINPGCYVTKDGGGTWTKINVGNGQSDRINDVAIDLVKPNVYYLSTYGTGHYRGTLAASKSRTPNQSPEQKPADARTWTDRSGRTLQAALLSVQGNQIIVRRKDGQVFKIPVETLSDDDREYLRQR